MNKRLFILLSFYFGLYTALAQTDHWETILFSSHVWQYHPGNTPVDPNWKSVSYDDSAWLSGMGGIGYGDGDDKTVIDPVLSLFYRRAFDVPDASAINQALLHIDFDDAFVAYLNGVEIARANIGVKGDNPAYNQPADGLREITGTPEGFLVDSIQSLIVTGTNVLAVQVHNQDISSSDLSSNTWFSVGISTSASYFSPTPAWFRAPVEFTSSSLPIVSITTSGQEILSDMRIVAQLDLYQPVNGLANLTDTATTYRISIEKRGSSSLWFPKNSYSLETQTALGTNLNVGLLGMPPENDWILYAPYSDKSLIRNVLTYDLGNQLGQYAPRTRFCEVVINGEYKGIYILTEKIKRDLNRVNIARLDSTEISGDNLTGGYIVKIDRPKAGLSHDWYSEISGPASQDPGHRIGFVVEYPGHKDILPEQLAYISNYVKNFENALSGSFFTDWNWGYKNYIDVNSFIDFWLMNEITKNVDGYRLSTYFYKDKDSNGGKLVMGPLWDFNLAFGNADYCEGNLTSGWASDYNYVCQPSDVPFWWERLLKDPWYAAKVNCRWQELRSSTLSQQHIYQMIDNYVQTMGGGVDRNFQQWPILTQYVWPNNYVGNTYPNEIRYLKDWINRRLQWMDANMPGDCYSLTALENPEEGLILYPNPTSEVIQVGLADDPAATFDITLYTLSGVEVLQQAALCNGEALSIRHLPPGIYLVHLSVNGKQVVRKIRIVR